MTGKTFFNKIANNKRDFLAEFIDHLRTARIPFCVIGGLAVNAYAEPIVSLDLDIIITTEGIDRLGKVLPKEYKIKRARHSIDIYAKYSDLRIQIQRDERYQNFIERSAQKIVLGYKLPVATVEDVLQGKLWAYGDPERRPSKRQKDLADIMRLVEVKSSLLKHLPKDLQKLILQKQ
jgi:hypothetical protein